MPDPIYIRAARALSAQESFKDNKLPDVLADAQNNVMAYRHPDYSQYFTILQQRRMGQLTKTGMAAAIECLKDAGLDKPDAIITGTGKGSIRDTEKFLQHIREFAEGTLNPTPFIQSTYNSLNGLIGLHHTASGYNTTYVHRGLSLELAFTDAILLLQEGSANNVLVGSFEEFSSEHNILKDKLGYWKKELISSKDLLSSDTPGSLAGEGSFFFLLQREPANALARFTGMSLLLDAGIETVLGEIQGLLIRNSLEYSDIDLVLLGYNGDIRFKSYYDAVAGKFEERTSIQQFKTACGEFETASGFAIWLAAHILHRQEAHNDLILRRGSHGAIRNLLVYNNYMGAQHAIFLLQSVDQP